MDTIEYVAVDSVANAPTFDLIVEFSNWLGNDNAQFDGQNEGNVENGELGADPIDVDELSVMNMTFGLVVAHFEGLKLFL